MFQPCRHSLTTEVLMPFDPKPSRRHRLILELEIAGLGVVLICGVLAGARYIWGGVFGE